VRPAIHPSRYLAPGASRAGRIAGLEEGDDVSEPTVAAAGSPSEYRSGRVRRVVVSAGGVDVVEGPAPRPGPGEALIRPRLAGICGSDLHAAAGRHPNVTLPYHPGHEVVGVVAAVGDEVTAVRAGQRVVVEPYLPCGGC
jgi:hypothetical protein